MEEFYVGRIIREKNQKLIIEGNVPSKSPQEDQAFKDFFMAFLNRYGFIKNTEYIIRSLQIMFQEYHGTLNIKGMGDREFELLIQPEFLSYCITSPNGFSTYSQSESRGTQVASCFTNLEEAQRAMCQLTTVAKQLKENETFNLPENYRIIKTIYEIFFATNFNAQESTLAQRLQYMLAILSHFSVVVPEVYFYRNTKGVPVSQELISMTRDIQAYPNLQTKLTPVSLAKENENIIRIVGESIRALPGDVLANLKQTCMVLYAKEWCLPQRADVDEVCEYLKMGKEQVSDTLQLRLRIKKRIQEEA